MFISFYSFYFFFLIFFSISFEGFFFFKIWNSSPKEKIYSPAFGGNNRRIDAPDSLILFAMSFTLHIASTLYLPNSLWFLQKYIKLDQKSWKSTQILRRVNPMAACFHAFCLLPQLNSNRSSRHNIFCLMERAKQSRCKRWWWSEKKTIYRN